jgi:hypothetical protein
MGKCQVLAGSGKRLQYLIGFRPRRRGLIGLAVAIVCIRNFTSDCILELGLLLPIMGLSRVTVDGIANSEGQFHR